jgi:hypothetical protein
MAAGFAPLDPGFGSAGERSTPAGPALAEKRCASRVHDKSRGDPQKHPAPVGVASHRVENEVVRDAVEEGLQVQI